MAGRIWSADLGLDTPGLAGCIKSQVCLSVCLNSPFTAILISIPNFMNIFPLASSLGPLMFFTLDHLLCPAHKAEHTRRVLTGAGGGTGWTGTGTGNLSDTEASVGGRRVRRALSSVGQTMPFTHIHTANEHTAAARVE